MTFTLGFDFSDFFDFPGNGKFKKKFGKSQNFQKLEMNQIMCNFAYLFSFFRHHIGILKHCFKKEVGSPSLLPILNHFE